MSALRRKMLGPSVMTAGALRVSEGKARARIMAECVNALANRLDAAHLDLMAKKKKTKLPADANQRAKSIVDIATGNAAKKPSPRPSKKSAGKA